MDADEVDVVRQIRVCQPDMPRLGGADRLSDGVAGAVEILLQVLRGQITAQHDLVADDHTHDVGVGAGKLDGSLELLIVVLAVIVDPCAERDVDVVPGGELRNIAEGTDRAVGAHGDDLALEQLQVGVDLRIGRHLIVGRILSGPKRREGKTLDVRGPRGLGRGAVQKCPYRERQCREGRRNQQAR